MWSRRRLLLLSLAVLVVLAVVTDRFVIPEVMVGMIVTAPNADANPPDRPRDIVIHHVKGVPLITGDRVLVGPPVACLDVEVLGPGRDAEVRGTILVLHGLGDSKLSQAGIGGHLVRAGYRAVLVDHRGQGESTGMHLTYGVRESRDLVQVLDFLADRDHLAEPVGVLGFSYGGAVGLQLAARDERVKAVVSVSAFSSLRDVLPPYAGSFAPWAAWWLRGSHFERALERAGARAGFDPDDADCVRAAGHTHAHILVVHGRDDRIVPMDHAHRIHRAAGERGELVLLDGDHMGVTGDETGEVKERATRWFARWL